MSQVMLVVNTESGAQEDAISPEAQLLGNTITYPTASVLTDLVLSLNLRYAVGRLAALCCLPLAVPYYNIIGAGAEAMHILAGVSVLVAIL